MANVDTSFEEVYNKYYNRFKNVSATVASSVVLDKDKAEGIASSLLDLKKRIDNSIRFDLMLKIRNLKSVKNYNKVDNILEESKLNTNVTKDMILAIPDKISELLTNLSTTIHNEVEIIDNYAKQIDVETNIESYKKYLQTHRKEDYENLNTYQKRTDNRDLTLDDAAILATINRYEKAIKEYENGTYLERLSSSFLLHKKIEKDLEQETEKSTSKIKKRAIVLGNTNTSSTIHTKEVLAAGSALQTNVSEIMKEELPVQQEKETLENDNKIDKQEKVEEEKKEEKKEVKEEIKEKEDKNKDKNKKVPILEENNTDKTIETIHKRVEDSAKKNILLDTTNSISSAVSNKVEDVLTNISDKASSVNGTLISSIHNVKNASSGYQTNSFITSPNVNTNSNSFSTSKVVPSVAGVVAAGSTGAVTKGFLDTSRNREKNEVDKTYEEDEVNIIPKKESVQIDENQEIMSKDEILKNLQAKY